MMIAARHFGENIRTKDETTRFCPHAFVYFYFREERKMAYAVCTYIIIVF